MSTKKNKNGKRPVKRTSEPRPTLRAENERLQQELKALRAENRLLKRNLAAMVFKDDPVDLALKPEDGVANPSLVEIIAELGKAG